MLAAIDRIGTESRQRRFFVTKRGFSEKEKAFFMQIDFVNHVALVAQTEEDERPFIIGGARYVVVKPGQAEVAFMVVDAYQGQGIGAILTRHLAGLARAAGLKELIAEVLPGNTAMLKVLNKFGFRPGPPYRSAGGAFDPATALADGVIASQAVSGDRRFCALP